MTSTVARLGTITNITHGFIYFAPEAAEEYDRLGLSGRQHYFAGRAAPMGAVGPELVVATFFNFCPTSVATALPSAWEIASPSQVQAARMRAAQRVLEACCADIPLADIDEAIALAQAMADGVGDEGKPLAAANRAVALPDEPLLRLWQLVTVIREWRGDAHVAVLTSAPVTAVEALVLHAATGTVPVKVLRTTRAWPDADWQAGIDSLAERGLVESDGSFTDAGRSFREQIESDTNRAAQPLVDAIGDEAGSRLCDLLEPVRDALFASGVFSHRLGASTDDDAK